MTERTADTFGAWLRRQAHRNDMVGDLAQDFGASGSRATTVAGVKANLAKHRAHDVAWHALEVAMGEWGA